MFLYLSNQWADDRTSMLKYDSPFTLLQIPYQVASLHGMADAIDCPYTWCREVGELGCIRICNGVMFYTSRTLFRINSSCLLAMEGKEELTISFWSPIKSKWALYFVLLQKYTHPGLKVGSTLLLDTFLCTILMFASAPRSSSYKNLCF